MRTLITGGGGQLASDLEALLGDRARVYSRQELDISDVAALERVFEEVDPELVINCAAFHNVDVCEVERQRSWEVNVEAVRELALRSPRLVHVSTNYVFDGRRPAPYAEDDLPDASLGLCADQAGRGVLRSQPMRRTRWWCARAACTACTGVSARAATSWSRMTNRARESGPRPPKLKMVADQRLQPTFTADLAAAILGATEAGAEGIVHLTSSGACSWHEFTEAIMQRAGLDVPVEPVSTTIAPGGADRPLNGVLARPRTDALGLPALRPWDEALTDYMDRAGLAVQAALTN